MNFRRTTTPLRSAFYVVGMIIKDAVIERYGEVIAILRPELFCFIKEKNTAIII